MSRNSPTKRSSKPFAARAATVARDVHDVGTATKQMANHGITAIRDTALEYLDEGRSRIRHMGNGFQFRIRERPLKYILVAAGIGFLVGAFWSRR